MQTLPMRISEKNKLEKIIIVGDRVLIKPKTARDQTKSGLYLPPGVQERYIPLQAKEGDLAIYLQRDAIEINYLNERYFIVPQSAVLMLVREEDL